MKQLLTSGRNIEHASNRAFMNILEFNHIHKHDMKLHMKIHGFDWTKNVQAPGIWIFFKSTKIVCHLSK